MKSSASRLRTRCAHDDSTRCRQMLGQELLQPLPLGFILDAA